MKLGRQGSRQLFVYFVYFVVSAKPIFEVGSTPHPLRCTQTQEARPFGRASANASDEPSAIEIRS